MYKNIIFSKKIWFKGEARWAKRPWSSFLLSCFVLWSTRCVYIFYVKLWASKFSFSTISGIRFPRYKILASPHSLISAMALPLIQNFLSLYSVMAVRHNRRMGSSNFGNIIVEIAFLSPLFSYHFSFLFLTFSHNFSNTIAKIYISSQIAK